MKVLVKYNFIFDPAEVWSQMSQMDQDFANFFKNKGLEAELIDTGEKDKARLVYIRKTEDPMPQVVQPDKTVKQVKADLTRGRGFDGKFKK